MSKKLFTILIILPLLAGCGYLKNMNELLTLQELAKEGEAMDVYVEEQDKKFEQLLSDIREGTVKRNVRARSIMRKYGDPINDKMVEHNGEKVRMLLYRYAMEPFASEKVYFYFDSSGRLIEWEYIEAPAKESDR